MTDSTDSPDFSAEALMLAELAYLEHEHEKDTQHDSTTPEDESPNQLNSPAPHTDNDSTIRAHNEKEATELGDCDYATPCWTLKHSGLISMWTAMSIYLGGPRKEGQGQQRAKIPDASESSESIDCDLDPTASKGRNQPQVSQLEKPTKTAPDWVPNCPTCDRTNEYGRTMCDQVLPRTCSNDSLWRCPVELTQTRVEDERGGIETVAGLNKTRFPASAIVTTF